MNAKLKEKRGAKRKGCFLRREEESLEVFEPKPSRHRMRKFRESPHGASPRRARAAGTRGAARCSSAGRAAPSSPPHSPPGRPDAQHVLQRAVRPGSGSAQRSRPQPRPLRERGAPVSPALLSAARSEASGRGGGGKQQTPTRGCGAPDGGARPNGRRAGAAPRPAGTERLQPSRRLGPLSHGLPLPHEAGTHLGHPRRPGFSSARGWWEGELGRLTKAAPCSEPPSPRPPSLNSCSERLREGGTLPSASQWRLPSHASRI